MAKKPLFTAGMFTPTKWDTAEDKAKFANHFVRFVESGFKTTLFYDWFYKRLSMTFGHIAHYNRLGFYDVWFTDARKRALFLRRVMDHPRYGDPRFTYVDVEAALHAWVVKTGKYSEYLKAAADAVEATERAELTRLTAKYGGGA